MSTNEAKSKHLVEALRRTGIRPPSRKQLGVFAATACVVLFVIVACWPQNRPPVRTPDSPGYVNWPTDYVLPSGIYIMGPRPPVYPLFVDTFGTGPGLVRAQFVVSVLAWCMLGWVVARVPGVFAGGLFAASLPLWIWNFTLISESFSYSLLALTFAASLAVYRKWTIARATLWCACIVAFGFVRDTNLYAIPILAIPLAQHGFRKAAPLWIAAALIFVLGNASMREHQRWRWGLGTIVVGRIVEDEVALEYFRAAGMPTPPVLFEQAGRQHQEALGPLIDRAPELWEWIDTRGLATYQRYLITHPSTHADAYRGARARLYRAPFKNAEERALVIEEFEPSWLVRAASQVYGYTVPPWLWPFLLVVPGWEFARTRRLRPLGWFLIALMLVAYAQAYIGYHGGTPEEERHMMPAFLTYRVAVLVAIVAVIEMAREHRRPETNEASGDETTSTS